MSKHSVVASTAVDDFLICYRFKHRKTPREMLKLISLQPNGRMPYWWPGLAVYSALVLINVCSTSGPVNT